VRGVKLVACYKIVVVYCCVTVSGPAYQPQLWRPLSSEQNLSGLFIIVGLVVIYRVIQRCIATIFMRLLGRSFGAEAVMYFSDSPPFHNNGYFYIDFALCYCDPLTRAPR
jgi:hypothetical protein